MIPLIRSLLIALAIVSLPASAAIVKDLYSARVEVPSRSQDDFKAGLKQAMIRVIAKVSGLPVNTVSSEPRLAVDLDQAKRWVEQYAYQSETTPEGEEKLYLKALFAEVQINNLLQRAHLRFWPADRPATMVIPVIAKEGHKSYASDDDAVETAIKGAAYRYGIPLVTMDTLTRDSLPVDQAWFWNVNMARQAAALQPHDAILLARISESTGSGNPFYRGGWMLIEGENTTSLDLQATSLEQFFDQGFRWLAGQWARKYAVTLRTSGNESLMVVENINTAEDYQAVVEYLNQLDVVKSAFLLEAKPTQLEFALELKTGSEQFQRLLTLKPELQKLEQGDFNLLRYRWDANAVNH